MRKVFFMVCAVLIPLFSLQAASPNLVSNGDFSGGDSKGQPGWKVGNYNTGWGSFSWPSGVCTCTMTRTGVATWEVALFSMVYFHLTAGQNYSLKFDAKCTATGSLAASVKHIGSNGITWSQNQATLTTSMQTFSYDFMTAADDDSCQVSFNMGGGGLIPQGATVSLDNVSVALSDPTAVAAKLARRTGVDIAQLTPLGVKVNLVRPAQAEMKLYNLHGTLVADYSALLKASPAGLNTISLNNRQVSNGLYLLKISTGARAVSLPLSVIR